MSSIRSSLAAAQIASRSPATHAARRSIRLGRSAAAPPERSMVPLSRAYSATNTPPPHGPSASSSPRPPPRSGKKVFNIKVIHLFLGITGLGAFITVYGMLELYFALPQWPESVRTPLRRALRARNLKDYDRSEAFFKEALAAALALPPTALEPDPLLKLSGIYITYATTLEENNKRAEAYTVLRDGLSHFGPSPLSTDASKRNSGAWAGHVQLSERDHVRAIGLAQKLGQLALIVSSTARVQVYPVDTSSLTDDGPTNYLDAAEKHLSDALTAMLHLGLQAPSSGRVVAGRDVSLPSSASGSAATQTEDGLAEVEGGSVDRKGLGVTMEALAEIYARKGEYGVAGNLLIQAISTLLPPGSDEKPSIPDQCQAAMLMTTVSSHALHPHTPKAIKAARSWSLRALQVADGALQASSSSSSAPKSGATNTLVCRKALAVGSYNLGMLAELDGQLEESLKRFDTALKVSRDIGFSEGAKQAGEGIRRVRPLLSTSTK